MPAVIPDNMVTFADVGNRRESIDAFLNTLNAVFQKNEFTRHAVVRHQQAREAEHSPLTEQ